MDYDSDSFIEASLDNCSISRKEKLRHKCIHPGCSKSFSRPNRLATHARIHTGERPFKCDTCEKDYARKEHLERHIVISHSTEGSESPKERLPCESCSETFANKYSLSKHKKKFHLGKSYVCDICSKAFAKHNLLTLHRDEHFSRLPHSCDTCGKTFKFPNKLRLHLKTHEKKSYECKVCGLADFPTWSEVVKHKNLVHKLNENTEFKCKECKKAFSSQKVLDQHSMTHDSERLVHHCPLEDCPRFYCYERNLFQHIRTYHDEQRLKCPHCSKTFVSNGKLKYHSERFHSGKDFPKKSPLGGKRAKRVDEGSKKKPMAEILSGFDDVDPGFQKEVLLKDKVVDFDIDAIRVEISDKPLLIEDLEDESAGDEEDLFPQDAVHVCERKFKIHQKKSSILKYI